jgi:signal transduction histidine kinase/CheY-like chemotaxis protein
MNGVESAAESPVGDVYLFAETMGEFSSIAEVHAEQQRWRERVFTALEWGMAGAIAVTAAMFGFEDARLGLAFGLLAVPCPLIALLRNRVPFRVAAWIASAHFYLVCLRGLAVVGLGPNVVLGCAWLVIFGTLLLGRRAGSTILALTSATLVAGAVLHHAGALAAPPNVHGFAVLRPLVIARIVFIYSALGALNVLAVSYLLERGERLLSQYAGALVRLRDEEREARRVRDELERQKEAFRRARELEILGRLSGMVAHDFSNALLVIQANVDLILAQQDHLVLGLGEIGGAVAQATSTVRQLRSFTQQAPVPAKPIALDATVTRTAKLLRRVLPSNIAVSVATGEAVTVLADEGRLQGIVTNLALNARDAMPGGGKLDLRVRKATNAELEESGLQVPCGVVSVTDDGTGMSEDALAHLFEPYFTTKGAAGTGLGLASVKSAVDAAGGRILVTSAPGRGTEVRILWPFYEGSITESNGDASAEPGMGQTGTVLIVEDEEHVRVALARLLASAGFTVLEAASGDEALIIARRYRASIHLLCSDCVMPGASVQQTIEGFRGLFKAARVMLCSGYAPEEVAPREESVDAFVTKPFASEAFVRLVGELVARARQADSSDDMS